MIDAKGEVVHLPEASVFVREVGEGPPLLLINGLGAHTSMWGPLEQSLRGFRIVEFDLPGAGQSAVPCRAVSIQRLARLAASLMDHCGMHRADVLGYSMGGTVAQQLAADLPERVRRLVLVATTPGRGAVQGDPKAMLNIMTPARYLSPRLYTKTIGSLVGGRARHDTAWIREQTRVRLQHAPTWRGYLGQLRSLTWWSGLPLLPRIGHPTLVVTGDDDPLAPAINAMMITHLLSRGRLLIVKGEGHLLAVDETSASHAPIREFFLARSLSQCEAWTKAVTVDSAELDAALAAVGRQMPPWSIVNAMARRRWLVGNTPAPPASDNL